MTKIIIFKPFATWQVINSESVGVNSHRMIICYGLAFVETVRSMK